VEQQLGDGSSQATNSAVPWQEFSRAQLGRLIAHLDLGTDIHKPGPDIATSDAIVRTVRYER
jgi:hypothetical protein